MDTIDLKLLELLQADARTPIPTLSDRVGLSAPACYRRIRRLREAGAIEREVAVVRPRTMGWPLMMIILVTLERDRAQTIDRFIRKLAAVPEVIEAWYVTGDHDFALRVVARDMESYDDFTRHRLSSDDSIRSFQTLVVMRHAKQASPIPVADV